MPRNVQKWSSRHRNAVSPLPVANLVAKPERHIVILRDLFRLSVNLLYLINEPRLPVLDKRNTTLFAQFRRQKEPQLCLAVSGIEPPLSVLVVLEPHRSAENITHQIKKIVGGVEFEHASNH